MRTSITLVMVLLLSTQAVRASLEFAGFIHSGGILRFVLTDKTEGSTSGWLEIGASFAGHTIIAYREEEEVLILRKGGGEVRLTLRTSRVDPGTSKAAQKEPQSRQNTLTLQISENGTIHDIEAVKVRLAAMRPTLRNVVYSDMQLPSNAPRNPREYHAFLLPAMLAFEGLSSEVGLQHAGGSVMDPERIDNQGAALSSK